MANFWIVTLLHTVSDVILGLDTAPYLIQNNAVDKSSLNEARYQTALYRVQIAAKYSTERILLQTTDSTEMFLQHYNVIQSKWHNHKENLVMNFKGSWFRYWFLLVYWGEKNMRPCNDEIKSVWILKNVWKTHVYRNGEVARETMCTNC
jgi:hypothetical protein